MKYLFLVLFSSIVFGILNALFEVYLEKEFEDTIIYHTQNEVLANVFTSAISAAISILIYSELEIYLSSKKHKLPIHDSIGVIIGAVIVYFFYKYYNRLF
mgnify:CR=1 FL=1